MNQQQSLPKRNGLESVTKRAQRMHQNNRTQIGMAEPFDCCFNSPHSLFLLSSTLIIICSCCVSRPRISSSCRNRYNSAAEPSPSTANPTKIQKARPMGGKAQRRPALHHLLHLLLLGQEAGHPQRPHHHRPRRFAGIIRFHRPVGAAEDDIHSGYQY